MDILLYLLSLKLTWIMERNQHVIVERFFRAAGSGVHNLFSSGNNLFQVIPHGTSDVENKRQRSWPCSDISLGHVGVTANRAPDLPSNVSVPRWGGSWAWWNHPSWWWWRWGWGWGQAWWGPNPRCRPHKSGCLCVQNLKKCQCKNSCQDRSKCSLVHDYSYQATKIE